MANTPNLNIPTLTEGQANKEATITDGLHQIDALLQTPVKDRDLTAPPGSPTEGDVYLVAAGATGAWAGQDGKLAHYRNAAWVFIAPKEGWQFYVSDENIRIEYDGAAWAQLGGTINVDGTDGVTRIDTGSGLSSGVTGGVATISANNSPLVQAVRAATTAARALATSFENGDTVDGVTLATGDRILIKDQPNAAENGVYTVNATGAPTRAADYDDNTDPEHGGRVPVLEGTANSGTEWQLTTPGPYTIGTTNLIYSKYLGAASGTVVLSTKTASNSANLVLKISDHPAGHTLDEFYKLELHFLAMRPTTDDAHLKLESSLDDGTSYQSAGYSTFHHKGNASANTVDDAASATSSYADLTEDGVDADASLGASGSIFLHPSSSGQDYVDGTICFREGSTGQIIKSQLGGRLGSSGGGADAFRVSFSIGNITSGTVRLIGYRK